MHNRQAHSAPAHEESQRDSTLSLAALRHELGQRDQDLRELRKQLALRDQQVREMTGLVAVKDASLTSIQCSLSWSLIQALRRVRELLAPPGTRRDRLVLMGIRFLRLWREAGLTEVVRRTYRKLRRSWPRHWLPDESGETAALLAQCQLTPDERQQQQLRAAAFAYRPLISFLTPVHNPPVSVLRDTIEAVRAQTYDHWELCLADGASAAAAVRDLLDDYARKDERIRVMRLQRNLGISGNSNVALDLARGEFAALLDHDDLVAPQMLYEVVRRLNDKPSTDILYFDEDKVSADARTHHNVCLKPGWSPELLLSTNLLMHSVVRRALLEEVGGFDPALDGAQDWDLMLRCSEKTERIEHIPQILYHWRQIPNSCAGYDHAKPYAVRAQRTAIAAHLRRVGIPHPRVTSPAPGILRSVWPTAGRKVSIIIPTKDKAAVLRRCLLSILKGTAYADFEVLLIDNGSTEPETRAYYETLRAEARVRIVDYARPFNYSAANNFGVRHASGDLLLFLNNDTEVLEADWLEELVRWAERPAIGAVGTKLLYANAAIQHAGVIMGLGGHAGHLFAGVAHDYEGLFGSVNWYRNLLAVTGACIAMRREVFERIDGFDEGYELAFSDVEICLRLVERGYRIVYTPFAALRHYEGQTRADYVPPADHARAYERMASLVDAGDPYFHPCLSYASPIPMVRRPHEEPRLDRLRRLVRQFTAASPPAVHQAA